mmetsp:Transcript_7504/g.17026  ORF Transcript_7504/g.17026 Transcript_7504/m.17026 type:complete len:372 (+) Transcript_7504:231-1346(+)
MFDIEANLREISMAGPPRGCRDEDMLRLIDLCPFLASEKSQYNDISVLSLLRQNPQAACLQHPYRCGIGNTHPLALVVALGASLEVVQLMVHACPEALEEKLSGRRSVLHYAIAEGVNVEIIQYLTSQNPSLVSEVDSFQAIPLHLASTYPSSSPSVLRHLLHIHPEGAKSLDHKSQSPLHRACRSRVSLEKVQALIEANPEALFWNDSNKTTPLGWADRMDRRLSDPIPEVVEILGMMEDILRFGASGEGSDESGNYNGEEDEDSDMNNGKCHRAQQILVHFRSIQWWDGIRLAFARNIKLVSFLNVPIGLLPDMLSLLGVNASRCFHSNGKSEEEESTLKCSVESLFSVLVQCPDIVGSTRKSDDTRIS